MAGNENEAADLLDAYLERANTRARLAAIDDWGSRPVKGASTWRIPDAWFANGSPVNRQISGLPRT